MCSRANLDVEPKHIEQIEQPSDLRGDGTPLDCCDHMTVDAAAEFAKFGLGQIRGNSGTANRISQLAGSVQFNTHHTHPSHSWSGFPPNRPTEGSTNLNGIKSFHQLQIGGGFDLGWQEFLPRPSQMGDGPCGSVLHHVALIGAQACGRCGG